jgi:hypothetical protein
MTSCRAGAYAPEALYRAGASENFEQQSLPARLRSGHYKTRQEVAKMGCLFALLGGLFPRLALLILWIARPALVAAAFNTFLLPLLGIIFLPFTTLIYVIVYTPTVGLVGFDWFWIILAVLLDISHWSASYTQRDQVPGLR